MLYLRKNFLTRSLLSFCVLFLMVQGIRAKPLEKVSLTLQWLTQSQFAGYYVALDKGWYRQEGIDLTIRPGASDVNPITLVSAGISDFGTKWLADFIAAKDQGEALTSIAQVVQSNGLILISKAKAGIRTPKDFIGRRLGIWFFGNENQFYALMKSQGIPIETLNVKPLKWSLKPFYNEQFEVVTAMIYNEYSRVLRKGYQKKDINIINFSDYGLNFPGQVIFTRSEVVKNKPILAQKMVRASLRGWEWAMKHPVLAADIVMKYDKTKKLDRDHQILQMKEMIKLIQYKNRPLGYHDPKQVQFVLDSLLKYRVIKNTHSLEQIYTNKFL